MTFKQQKKKALYSPINFRLIHKRLHPLQSIKYLGSKIDKNLNWVQRIHDIETKPKKIIIRHYVNRHIWKTIYFAIFDTQINYDNRALGQNLIAVSRIVVLQKSLKNYEFLAQRLLFKAFIQSQPYSKIWK